MPSAERIPPDLVLHHGRGGGGEGWYQDYCIT